MTSMALSASVPSFQLFQLCLCHTAQLIVDSMFRKGARPSERSAAKEVPKPQHVVDKWQDSSWCPEVVRMLYTGFWVRLPICNAASKDLISPKSLPACKYGEVLDRMILRACAGWSQARSDS